MNQVREIIGNIQGVHLDERVNAGRLTSYCVGGDVDFLIIVDEIPALTLLFKTLKEEGIKFKICGAGTNILVSDKGFQGIFIKLGEKFKQIVKISDTSIYAGGGLPVPDLIAFLRHHKLGGLTFLAGIPGTIGGAIAMNAGAFSCDVSGKVIKVDTVSPGGEILELTCSDCEFGYRESRIKKENLVVLGTELSVIPNTEIDCEVEECIEKRSRKHTPRAHYAGSVFRNPPGGYAGKLIDDAGLRGLRIGSAFISEKHGNFIIADANGSASDVFEIMQVAAIRVYEFFGIKLQPEIELVGFDVEWEDIFK